MYCVGRAAVPVFGECTSAVHGDLIIQSHIAHTMSHPHCSYPSVASQCIEKKREITRKLEEKIEAGLGKYVAHMQAFGAMVWI